MISLAGSTALVRRYCSWQHAPAVSQALHVVHLPQLMQGSVVPLTQHLAARLFARLAAARARRKEGSPHSCPLPGPAPPRSLQLEGVFGSGEPRGRPPDGAAAVGPGSSSSGSTPRRGPGPVAEGRMADLLTRNPSVAAPRLPGPEGSGSNGSGNAPISPPPPGGPHLPRQHLGPPPAEPAALSLHPATHAATNSWVHSRLQACAAARATLPMSYREEGL
jgi:hypothetical protein